MKATTDSRHILQKADIANAIAAYLLTAQPNTTAQDALTALIVALGINPEYVAELLRHARR